MKLTGHEKSNDDRRTPYLGPQVHKDLLQHSGVVARRNRAAVASSEFAKAESEAAREITYKEKIEMKPSPVVPVAPIKTDLQKTDGGGDLQDQIRARAYQLYEQRGREDGHDLEDWLHAEADAEAFQVQLAA